MTISDEQQVAASYLWVNGAPLAEAARQIGVTVWRLKTVKKNRPDLFDEAERERRRVKPVMKLEDDAPAPARKEPAPAADGGPFPAKAPGHPGVTSAALGRCMCKFPLWGHGERFDPDSSLYCGAPADPGKPYCEFHQAVSLGEGTRSERDAIRAAKKLIGARGV